MFVNSKVNGFFLLVLFGVVCGVVAGAFAGFCVAGLFVMPSLLVKPDDIGKFFVLLVYGPVVGIGLAIIPGILFGLTSYFFTKRWHYLFDGGFYGAICYLIYAVNILLWIWPVFIACVLYGLFVGFINRTFPNWWGMRLRAEGIELLRQKS
ncbi:hypothetical protein [Spirosoma arcticum]